MNKKKTILGLLVALNMFSTSSHATPSSFSKEIATVFLLEVEATLKDFDNTYGNLVEVPSTIMQEARNKVLYLVQGDFFDDDSDRYHDLKKAFDSLDEEHKIFQRTNRGFEKENGKKTPIWDVKRGKLKDKLDATVLKKIESEVGEGIELGLTMVERLVENPNIKTKLSINRKVWTGIGTEQKQSIIEGVESIKGQKVNKYLGDTYAWLKKIVGELFIK